jgi:hypothetical protein
MTFRKEIHTASELDAAFGRRGGEPMTIEIATRKRTFRAILCGVKKNGTFDIAVPQMDDGSDEPFEMTYHIDDVRVFAD